MCFDGVYTNSKIPFDEHYKSILILGDGTRYEDGTGKITLKRTSIPTNYLNVKVNIASSENANNAIQQKRFNDYLPYTTPAQKRDPRVKNTMEFVDCVVFIRENDPDLTTHREFQDTEYHFYAIGNVGDSKKTDYTRVNDANDPKEFVVEIMDNTLPNSTFSGSDEALAALDADQFDEDGTYGFRYEMSGITDEQRQTNMQVWREFYRFVATSSDEDFISKLKDWFIVDSALYFYLFTERYTMIDNRAKNTFWHYSKIYISQAEADLMGDEAKYYTIDDEAAQINDGYRFEFWDYDNDTALGINNSGELTMTYGKEDIDYRTEGVPSSGYIFNASESTFFKRIRNLMYDQLAAMYLKCESQGCWSASSLIKEFDERQANFSEELWRVDYVRKYERTYRDGNVRFLEQMMNGRKKYQRRQFERDQEPYFGTKYFGTSVTSDQIMFRCNTPVDAVVKPDYTLHLTPYSDMYLSVMFGATYRKQIRAKAGQTYDIECPFSTMDDTAVLIYSASRIQSMGDVSACYIHDNDFSKANKLEELIIGNATEGYSNEFLTKLTIGNIRLLKHLNIQNTPNLSSSLNLSGCESLEELYAEGSGLTGVVFANGGKVRIAHLPAISTLTVKNLIYLEDFLISNFNNMQTLIIEHTPFIDSYSFVNDSPNLTNARLLGIDWGADNGIVDTSILDRLLTIGGIDNSGYLNQVSVLSGKFYSPIVKQMLLADYVNAWSDLEIRYDTLIEQYTVTFINEDGTVLDVQYVDKGGNAIDPITREINPITTPLKASSVSTDYTFSAWDSPLTSVFSDRVIKATYTESTRKYTITYKSKGVILQETTDEYGKNIPYSGEIPTYTLEESAYKYYWFTNWDKSGIIDGDKVVNAVFDTCTYTEGYFDGKDLSQLRPVEIYAMTKLGLESSYVVSKDSIILPFGNDYNYDDVESTEIISERTIFNGENYIDSEIQLFEEDRDFVFAVDYSMSKNSPSLGVLVQCFQANGSNGFKLWNNNGAKLMWSTASQSVGAIGVRDIMVIRHIKGENGIHVYHSDLDLANSEPTYIEMSRNKTTIGSSTLVFGCQKADDGVYENFATGEVYWAKVWFADLGDSACKQLAIWTKEKLTMQMTRFKNYYLSDDSGKRCSMTFLADRLLSKTMSLTKSGNSSNVGGWAETTLNPFMNDRLYRAIAPEWRKLLKQVKIGSSMGGQSVEISYSNCYLTIPAVIEVDASKTSEPYIFEGTSIPFITTTESRIRNYENGDPGTYWTRSPNASHSTYYYSVDSVGSVNGYNYPYYKAGILLECSI